MEGNAFMTLKLISESNDVWFMCVVLIMTEELVKSVLRVE
jgi:hypothetical protein